MNDQWLDFAIRIQSIAQAGLQYGKDKYDKERYNELRKIAAEMMAAKTDLPVEKVYGLFCNESGYSPRKLIPVRQFLLMGKSFLSMKITEPGLSPVDGAMWISPSHPTPRRKFLKKPAVRYTPKN